MSHPVRETTTVVIIGAGVAGLTTANMLRQTGVDCVVLERQSRVHVEQRQRAGNLEARAVRRYEDWGLAERVVGGVPYEGILELRVHGVSKLIREERDEDTPGRMCPQQVLVRNLIKVFLDDGGDLRFGAADVDLVDVTSEEPSVRYRDAAGTVHEIRCTAIAGCDGDRGVSRASIPDSVLTRYVHDFGYSWLTVLAEVPAGRHPLMALDRDGLAAHFPRGPKASRFYLQVSNDDTTTGWSDERVWEQLRNRLNDEDLPAGPISDKAITPIRGVVYAPMSYGKLFLLGDAAHLVPPSSVKGMSLAIHDADVFAGAVRDFVHDDDKSGLETYSEVCLRHTWNYQDFAVWITEMLHNAGDDSYGGAFAREIARARLERLFHSPTALRLYSELMAGTN